MALRALADGKIFAEVTGDAPPRVLALHGWGRRGSDLTPILAGLGAIAPDLPGFGATPAPSEVIGASEYAERIVPVLDLFERPPVILGHSFGGRVAVCLAAANPELVGPLVLTGVPLVRSAPSTRPGLGFRLMRSLNRIGLVSDESMESARKGSGSADYRAAAGVMRGILVKVVNESYEDQLSRLTAPVRLIWGSVDTEVPLGVGAAARRILESAGCRVELTILEGVGHMTPIEAPAELRAAVREALAL